MTGGARRIVWQAVLRVKDERAASKLLSRIGDRLELPISVDTVEPHRHDTSLYRCFFSTPVPGMPDEDGADAILDSIGRLAPRWDIGGSVRGKTLNGLATDGISVAGVTWVNFDVSI